MDIDEMEGRELDVKVAELMGWNGIVDYEQVVLHDGNQISRVFGKVGFRPGTSSTRYSLPRFSTNLAAAFQAVKKMQRDGWWPDLDWFGDNELWLVTFFSPLKGAIGRACASKIELAICRAALKAVEGGQNDTHLD